jgi:hypothetical protein
MIYDITGTEHSSVHHYGEWSYSLGDSMLLFDGPVYSLCYFYQYYRQQNNVNHPRAPKVQNSMFLIFSRTAILIEAKTYDELEPLIPSNV